MFQFISIKEPKFWKEFFFIHYLLCHLIIIFIFLFFFIIIIPSHLHLCSRIRSWSSYTTWWAFSLSTNFTQNEYRKLWYCSVPSVSDLGQCFGDPPAPGSAQGAVPAGSPGPVALAVQHAHLIHLQLRLQRPSWFAHLNALFILDTRTSPAVAVLKTPNYFPWFFAQKRIP
jgi:hypothetical protein